MELGIKISLFVLFIFAFFGKRTDAHECNFPAVFNFGDSNSDTGQAYTLLKIFPIWPNGLTVGKEFKRASDGRLIIDFLLESLGLPYLNASADVNGTSFRYGANFAVGSQRINPDKDFFGPNWNYPMADQISRFFAFKSAAISNSKQPESKNIYPKPEAFSEALYTIDIGQNDVNSNFGGATASAILDFFAGYVRRLLKDGAKYMWIHNTGPLGCTPMVALTTTTTNRGKDGCNLELNKKAQEFNFELKKRVNQLRKEYPNAVITLVDMYSVKYRLINNNNEFNKELKFDYCCGGHGYPFCGGYNENRTMFGGNYCNDPSKYISWDGGHYTEAANKIIAKLILDGAYSEPRVAFANACHK